MWYAYPSFLECFCFGVTCQCWGCGACPYFLSSLTPIKAYTYWIIFFPIALSACLIWIWRTPISVRLTRLRAHRIEAIICLLKCYINLVTTKCSFLCHTTKDIDKIHQNLITSATESKLCEVAWGQSAERMKGKVCSVECCGTTVGLPPLANLSTKWNGGRK